MSAPVSWEVSRQKELAWNTQFYINESAVNQVTVALIPSRKLPVAKPGGGHDWLPAPAKSPQTFRLIKTGSFDGIELSPNDDGMSRKFSYVILAPADSDIEFGDTWSENNDDDTANHYHVDSVEPSNNYEIRADVTCFAVEAKHG